MSNQTVFLACAEEDLVKLLPPALRSLVQEDFSPLGGQVLDCRLEGGEWVVRVDQRESKPMQSILTDRQHLAGQAEQRAGLWFACMQAVAKENQVLRAQVLEDVPIQPLDPDQLMHVTDIVFRALVQKGDA